MRKKIFPFFIVAVLAVLLLNPSRYFGSVQRGVALFASSVLPSMLPYFFFTKVLTGTGCVKGLAETLGKPVGKGYRVSGIAAYPLVMSLLAGYPVGARVVADLHAKGLLSGNDAARAASFSSTSGSMFVLGTVGSAILGDPSLGVLILISHYLGAILNGFLYRGKRRCVPLSPCLPEGSAEHLLSDAMYESVLSLALVGGFIALCNLLGDMAADLASWAGGRIEGTLGGGFLYAFFEVTRGCVEFSSIGLPRVWLGALCCFAISFGGLSVLLQSLAFLGKTGLKTGKFLLMKITQASISFSLCLIGGYLFLS